MYNVKNIRHGMDFGKMSKEDILKKWPNAKLDGTMFRAGKYFMVCEPVKKPKKKAEPKPETDKDNG